MTKNKNKSQIAFKQSVFKRETCYSLTLCGLTLLYPKTADFSLHSILSLDGFEYPLKADDTVFIPFQFDKIKITQQSAIPQHAFTLYAPSLLVLWALAAKKENSALIHTVYYERSLSKFFLFYLKTRLSFERFRLGSDVESFFIRTLLHRDGLDKYIPHISIKQWLEWIDIIS